MISSTQPIFYPDDSVTPRTVIRLSEYSTFRVTGHVGVTSLNVCLGLYVSADRARGVRGSAIFGLSESLDMSGFETAIVFL
jgi:hypothetical protein